jgi:hypothetical protein
LIWLKPRRVGWKRWWCFFLFLVFLIILVAPIVAIVGNRFGGNPFFRLFAIDVGFERDLLVSLRVGIERLAAIARIAKKKK